MKSIYEKEKYETAKVRHNFLFASWFADHPSNLRPTGNACTAGASKSNVIYVANWR